MILTARISMAVWLVLVFLVGGILSIRTRRGRSFSAAEMRRLHLGFCMGAVGEGVTLWMGGFFQ